MKVVDDTELSSAVEMAVKEKVSLEDAWLAILIDIILFLVFKESPETG